MMYKNTIKLIFSNFSLVFKFLIYFVFITCIVGGIGYFCWSFIAKELAINELLAELPQIFKSYKVSSDRALFLMEIRSVVFEILNILLIAFQSKWYLVILLGLLVAIIPSVLYNLYIMSMSNVLHYYMGSSVNFSFTASLFVNFRKNLRYQLLNIFTVLPIKYFTYLLVIDSFILLKFDGIMGVLAPFIIVLIYVLLTALRMSLFAGWVPYMVVKNSNVFAGIINGYKYIRKRFARIFACSFAIVLTNILLSILGLFTFGVSLIITIPLAFVFIAVFNMVAYYSSSGLRFYVDTNNIFAPKKSEMVENYRIYKYVI